MGDEDVFTSRAGENGQTINGAPFITVLGNLDDERFYPTTIRSRIVGDFSFEFQTLGRLGAWTAPDKSTFDTHAALEMRPALR